MPRRLTVRGKWGSLRLMSKQCPSKTARDTKPVGRAEIQNFWSKRLFKNTYTREGRRVKLAGWSIKIQHLGRRHTFSLATLDRASAAIEAKAIYDTIATEGRSEERRVGKEGRSRWS